MEEYDFEITNDDVTDALHSLGLSKVGDLGDSIDHPEDLARLALCELTETTH